MLIPGLLLFDRCSPANPFIARQRCDVLPGRKRCRICGKGRPQIRWQAVNDTARYFLIRYSHTTMLLQSGFRAYREPLPEAFKTCFALAERAVHASLLRHVPVAVDHGTNTKGYRHGNERAEHTIQLISDEQRDDNNQRVQPDGFAEQQRC